MKINTIIIMLASCLTLAAKEGEMKETSITITAPANIPYSQVCTVLEACNAEGISKISFSGPSIDDPKNKNTILNFSSDTPFKTVTKILTACKKAGMNQITLASNKPKGK